MFFSERDFLYGAARKMCGREFIFFKIPIALLFFFVFFQIVFAAEESAVVSKNIPVSPALKMPKDAAAQNYEALLNKGMDAAGEGLWMDACALFQRALSQRQDFLGAYLALGTAFLKLGRTGDAAESFERLALLKISSGDDTISCELEQKIKSRFLDDAVETCRQTVIIIPHSFEANSSRACLAIYAGNYAEAVEYYRHLLRIKPDYTDARYYLGAAYHKLGNYRQSITELKKYAAIDAENAEARMFLGLNYLMLHEIAAAKEEYKIVNAIDKEKGLLLKELISHCEKNGPGIDK